MLVGIYRCVFRGRLRPQPQPRYAVCLRSKATERLEDAWRLQLRSEWVKANISYQVTSARRGLRASRSRCLSVHSGTIVSSRCEGRNADGGEAAGSGASRLCTRDGVLSRCTSNLLSPPRFTPLLSASLSLQVGKSKPLQTPAPRHDPHPTFTQSDSTHVVDSPWRPPLLPVVAVRHTKAALSCTVLSDSPVTPLPTNHCFSTAATN